MKNRYNTFGILTLLSLLIALVNCTPPKHQFKYAAADTKGFSPQKLDTLSAFLEKAGSSGMLLMVDGKVIYEWGKTDRKHTIHSIRKPMLNALFGIKVAEGVIDTTMTLRELSIDDIEPSLSENEKNARIADLLKSRSGVYHDAAAVSKGMLYGKPERDEHKPGEHYYYNNWDFNVLGAILEQTTGKSIYTLFNEEIAVPLGMNDFQGVYTSIDGESEEFNIPDTDGFYQYENSKSKFPAYHFRLSARDMALFGQLYLNKGKWNGKQIIPESWIERSTTPYSVTNPDYGIAYGMLWNVLMKTENRKSRSFFHTGTGIHMLGVYPSSKLVLVHRVDTEKEYSFNQGDFYKMIDLVFGARMD
ncbi:serine hydrolase domain-containing protein [Xanthovirga aplysinae]|uniref:serine hydrolase domain-containing protein n=1 Tax=Xanthovirga aplysinae TaxID=2529853 RepID=UPI0012BC9B16|nr:serine hydrolase [Xanthovirga aplysinae]MTI33112.1 class C beta-lactamase-related serine hydrolase [Xanthovirga aplysinae]